MWSKIKAFLRAVKARTVQTLEKVIPIPASGGSGGTEYVGTIISSGGGETYYVNRNNWTPEQFDMIVAYVGRVYKALSLLF